MKQDIIIPFGKYKGQPIAALSKDVEYIEWIKQQGWLAEKYPQINTLIINNFSEPSETPDHNKIQGMFLNEDFIKKFSNKYANIISKVLPNRSKFIINILNSNSSKIEYLKFEKYGIDVLFSLSGYKLIKKVNNSFQLKFKSTNDNNKKVEPCQEEYEEFRDLVNFRVEIKPIIGDDYPSVLRQIISLHGFDSNSLDNILLVDNYNGIGISQKDFVKLFYTQGIVVIFLKDII